MKFTYERFSQLNTSLGTGLSVKLFRAAPDVVVDASMRRFDDQMYVVPYLYSINTPDSPAFFLKRTEEPDCVFRTYETWFDGLFSLSQQQAAEQHNRAT